MKEEELIEVVRSQLLGNKSHPKQTLDLCRQVKGVEGDFCECGVAYGSMSALMANFITENNLNKKLFMVDSFQGIPYPTEDDDHFPGGLDLPKTGELKSSGISSSSLQEVLERFKQWKIDLNVIQIFEGWIEETIDKISSTIEKLSFLRVDVDLYRPTKICLERLGSKVSKGGIIMVHDNMPGCIKAVSEYTDINKVIINPDDGGCYWEVK